VLSIALSYACDHVLTPRALHEGMRRYAVALGALLSASIVLTPYVGSVGLATVVLTVLSLVPDAIADAGPATRALLMLTHLVAAAIVIPAVARRLAT